MFIAPVAKRAAGQVEGLAASMSFMSSGVTD